ncbi:lysophospholipid acyltransferase family protein [Mesobacillus harenae]|uniref:lysophospholipid acyltransferase family protein n=1 Tax=Mesobacillus harenae TaxID=2213203 RepID=UPI0015805F18|nr:lysophospholipid acyltransferase family protein [Mesobacillus harenae]
MLRLIACFLYMSGYLVYSIPKLKIVNRLPADMPVNERDRIAHVTPQKWSKTIIKLTGSKVDVYGEEKLPEGPVVFVCNHEGDFDIPVLLGYINKPFGFISKIEVKRIPILSSWMAAINCVFLDRKDRMQAVGSIGEGIRLLEKGHSIAIFPEGTRSKGGPIGEFKSGGFRLAKGAEVPIVPISIAGTSKVFEQNGKLVKPAEITVTICPHLEYAHYKGRELKELAEDVRQTIISTQSQKRIAS